MNPQDRMSGEDFDLLNPENAYSRFGNARKSTPDYSDEKEITSSGGLPLILADRISNGADGYISSNEEQGEDRWENNLPGSFSTPRESIKDTVNGAAYPEEDESLDLSGIAEGRRLVIAIDYGTTFTGVAIALVPVEEKYAKLSDIKVTREWGKNMSNTEKVPSVYSYTPPTSGEEQWGNDFSPDAVTMVHTKLELDAQRSKLDELDMIIHNMDGMHDLHFDQVRKTNGNPDFTAKKPEIVVEDYMHKVFNRVMKSLSHIPAELRNSLPVDIVITHPVVWSYKAKNATFRAVTRAGFNHDTFPKLRDIMMLSEPEAAAVYTARYLKEDDPDKTLLTKDDCFVLCDAGGGTVDVVTFRVVDTEPTLELQQIGEPHSRKCGSVFIDGVFKQWLRDDVLDPSKYEKLEPNTKRRIKPHSTTGKRMRDIMEKFIEHKRAFTGQEDDDALFTIELPKEFEDLVVDGCLSESQLTINIDTMVWLFEECVDAIVELIKVQAKDAEEYEEVRRVKSIFMIGGFGESKYLRSAIEENLGERNIRVNRPKTSWSAVVRGACLYGIEKARLKNYVRTAGCPHFYAIAQDQEEIKGRTKHQYEDAVTGKTMGRNHLSWIVQRGDLALLSSTDCQETLLAFNFREHDDRKFTIPVYRYLENDEFLPPRVRGQKDIELIKVLEIPVSFADMKLDEFDVYQGPKGSYYQAVVSLYLTCRNESVMARVVWKNNVLYSSNSE